MSFSITWDDQHPHILRTHIRDSASWDLYHELITAIVQAVGAVSHRVSVVMTADVGLPSGNAFLHMRWAADEMGKLSNLDWCISVDPLSKNSFLAIVMTVGARIYGIDIKKYPVVASVEAAYALIGVTQPAADSPPETP